MSPFKTSVIAALVSAALTAGCLYYFHRSRAQEATDLRRKNTTMRLRALQLAHAQPLATAQAAADATARPAETSPVPQPKPVENYRNEGRRTPLAALQTFAWACDRGDTETVAKLLFFDGEARKKSEAFLATMPEKIRTRWKSVDEMAATLLTSAVMERPYPSADILEVALTERSGDDRVIFRLPGAGKDRTAFQKTADGWSYVISEALVDAYVAQSKAPR